MYLFLCQPRACRGPHWGLLEQESFWLQYERTSIQPQVYFARRIPKQDSIEIGLNCLVRIKPKVIKINHKKFPSLRVQSDGTTFRIILKATEVSESPRIIDADPKDNLIQVMLLAPKVEQNTNPKNDEETSENREKSLDSSSKTPELSSTEDFLKAEGKVLLPQPDMLDQLTSEKLAGSNNPVQNENEIVQKRIDKPKSLGNSIESPGKSTAGDGAKDELNASSAADSVNANINSTEPSAELVSKESAIDSKDVDKKTSTESVLDEPFTKDSVSSNQGADEWGYQPSTPSYQKLDTDVRLILFVFGLLVFCSAVLVLWYRAKFGGRKRARQQLFGDSLGPSDLSPYYALLGVRGSDSNDAIKKRYKHLIKVFHADKLSAQDLPEEMVSLANERFQQIQDAYQKIKTVRGF